MGQSRSSTFLLVYFYVADLQRQSLIILWLFLIYSVLTKLTFEEPLKWGTCLILLQINRGRNKTFKKSPLLC